MSVVITGASRGLGKAIAIAFAQEGYNLYLSSATSSTLNKTVEELKKQFPAINIQQNHFDLSKKEAAQSLGDWILRFGGRIDILVNNAGSFEPGGVHNEADGVLENQIAVNLYSAYHLTRRLLASMMKQEPLEGTRGHIFNMCSIASLHAYNNGGAYSISKFALYGFSKNLREEMKPHGIKVTAVMPGAVLTDSWGNFDNSSRRIMEASDIAKIIVATSQLSPQACVEDIIIRPQQGDL
ncbi:MAG: SDR family oxidoreductase [Chitinophagaceae bacterium]|nr:SDR family oxidoreductase [Chitinophagaceae bacterium]